MTPLDQVKLMDSGTALFLSAPGREAVHKRVCSVLGREKGKVMETGAGLLELDSSGLFRYCVIVAHIDDGAVSFQEGNALTPLGRLVTAGAAIFLLVLLLFVPGFPEVLRLLGGVAVLLGALYFLAAPSRACQKRMQRILKALQ